MGSQARLVEKQPGGRRSDLAVTSIRIERERLEAFKSVAAANRRTVSQELRWLIDRHIDRQPDLA